MGIRGLRRSPATVGPRCPSPAFLPPWPHVSLAGVLPPATPRPCARAALAGGGRVSAARLPPAACLAARPR
eukprot:6053983-Alexandrium_andersonii.AAC.1